MPELKSVALLNDVIDHHVKVLKKYRSIYRGMFRQRLKEDIDILGGSFWLSVRSDEPDRFYLYFSDRDSFSIDVYRNEEITISFWSAGQRQDTRLVHSYIKITFQTLMNNLYNLLEKPRETGKRYEDPKLERWM